MTCWPTLNGEWSVMSWALSAACEKRSSLSFKTWEVVSGAVEGLSSGLSGSMVGVLANNLSNGEIPSSLGVELRPHWIGGSSDGQSLVSS